MIDKMEFKKRINESIKKAQEEIMSERFNKENYQVFNLVNKRQ